MSVWWLVAPCIAYFAARAVCTWLRQRALTEQCRDEEWAKTLAVAADCGWPPYVAFQGLSRSAELAWRETYLRMAPHCQPLVCEDGRVEWIYVQPDDWGPR